MQHPTANAAPEIICWIDYSVILGAPNAAPEITEFFSFTRSKEGRNEGRPFVPTFLSTFLATSFRFSFFLFAVWSLRRL